MLDWLNNPQLCSSKRFTNNSILRKDDSALSSLKHHFLFIGSDSFFFIFVKINFFYFYKHERQSARFLAKIGINDFFFTAETTSMRASPTVSVTSNTSLRHKLPWTLLQNNYHITYHISHFIKKFVTLQISDWDFYIKSNL